MIRLAFSNVFRRFKFSLKIDFFRPLSLQPWQGDYKPSHLFGNHENYYKSQQKRFLKRYCFALITSCSSLKKKLEDGRLADKSEMSVFLSVNPWCCRTIKTNFNSTLHYSFTHLKVKKSWKYSRLPRIDYIKNIRLGFYMASQGRSHSRTAYVRNHSDDFKMLESSPFLTWVDSLVSLVSLHVLENNSK